MKDSPQPESPQPEQPPRLGRFAGLEKRPVNRRSTAAGLEVVAARLDGAQAPLCAALVREAAEVYTRRGLLTA